MSQGVNVTVTAGAGPYVSPMLKPNMSPPQGPTLWGVAPPPFAMPGSVASDPKSDKKLTAGGTDPTKYKTAMCRNWEHTGACGFRGCTFAHGREELRPPRPPSAGGASPILSANQSPVAPSAPQPPKTPSQDPLHGSLPPPVMPLLPAATLQTNNGSRTDQLLQDLTAELKRVRETLHVHQEANRTLEMLLHREQMQRHADKAELLELRERVRQLEAQLDYQNGALNGDPTSPHNDDDQERLKSLLNSLQM